MTNPGYRQKQTVEKPFMSNSVSGKVTHVNKLVIFVAAIERLPEHHHSADYISFPLG